MKFERDKSKTIFVAVSTLIIGFGSGFVFSELSNKNAAQASPPAAVVVEKVKDPVLTDANKLVAPNLWDIYVDPLWAPVVFTVKPLPLLPILAYPDDIAKVQTIDGDKELRVIAQVPGMTEKDVKVQASEDSVTIKGRKAQEQKDKGRFESVEESFQQTVHLPSKVNPDKVQATIKDGVLTVLLPKKST
jgi:hypothetical protein